MPQRMQLTQNDKDWSFDISRTCTFHNNAACDQLIWPSY